MSRIPAIPSMLLALPLAALLTTGCGDDADRVDCEPRALTVTGDLATDIVGQWEDCAWGMHDMEGPEPTRYCDFRADGTWISYAIADDGAAAVSGVRSYELEGDTLIARGTLPEGSGDRLVLASSDEESLSFRTPDSAPEGPHRFRAVTCADLPQASSGGE